MANDFGVEVDSADARRKMEQVARDLYGAPMVAAFQRASALVARDAKINAPRNIGTLSASITAAIEADPETIQGIVGSNLAYAPHMEFGTGTFAGKSPHYPPAAALDVWAQRHGFSSGAVVARIIGRRGGLAPRKYLTNALEANRAQVTATIENAVQEITQK